MLSAMQPTIILRGHGVRGISVVPWHPLLRTYGEPRRMTEQLRQIVERIDLIQFAGVNQAHEEVAHPRSVHRLIEQRILSMKNRFLQSALNYVVIQRGTLLPQE